MPTESADEKTIPLVPPAGVKLSTQVQAPSHPAQVGDVNIAPTTTAADDLITAGQRSINRLWELTQSVIAVAVTGATLYIAGSLALRDGPATETAFLLLSNTFFLVISVYVQRTNHQKTGGVQKGDVGR